MGTGSESRDRKQIESQCRHLGIPRLDLVPEMIDPAVAGRIDLEDARRLGAVPVSEEDGQITVAMVDPTDREVLAYLQQVLSAVVVPVYSAPEAIGLSLEHLQQWQEFRLSSKTAQALNGQGKEKSGSQVEKPG